jgi:hypothetical protein
MEDKQHVQLASQLLPIQAVQRLLRDGRAVDGEKASFTLHVARKRLRSGRARDESREDDRSGSSQIMRWPASIGPLDRRISPSLLSFACVYTI